MMNMSILIHTRTPCFQNIGDDLEESEDQIEYMRSFLAFSQIIK